MASKRRARWGHVERVSEGRYRIFWEGRPKADGSRNQRTRTVYGSRRDAELQLAKERIALEGVTFDLTYDELWVAVVQPSFEKDGLGVRTVDGYERVWRRELQPRIGADRVADTRYGRVEEVLAEVESAWVQRSCFLLWRKMVNLAIREGLAVRNPVDRYVRRKPTIPARRPLLDAASVGEWMEGLRGFQGEAVLLAEAGTGLRVEEGAALVASDLLPFEARGRRYVLATVGRALVSSDHGRVLKGVKNEFSERTVAIGEPFASRLLEAMPEQGPLCPGRRRWDGGPLEAAHFAAPDHMTNAYRAWCRERGMPYVNPGKLRKSWSVMQGEARSPDSVVSLAMGHSDGTTRGRSYMSLTRRAALDLADALTELIREEGGWPRGVAKCSELGNSRAF